MDKDLKDAVERLSKSECVENQVDSEIIRYWNNRIHQNDTTANRAFRQLIHDLIFNDTSSQES